MPFHARRPGRTALASLVLLGCAAAGALAAERAATPVLEPMQTRPAPVSLELLNLRLVRMDGRIRNLSAILARPDARGRAPADVPAVILVPDGLGLDQRISALAERLALEGWATLEIDIDPVSTDGHAPQGPFPLAAEADAREVVGDLALALQELSEEPGIDPNRIAVVGLGTGGRAALLAGSEAAMSHELDTFGPRFAAHAALYPGCGPLLAEGFGNPAPWSSAPAAAFHAGQDAQNANAACETLVNALATRRRHPALWHVYPTATYAWDLGAAMGQTAIRLANLGPPAVPVAPAFDIAEDASSRLIAFLRPILGPPGRR
ncbi:dienelactone hydrolase family protein [Muricoccus vinaceus]|uniref:Dienelactone hydrolase family protein n=1 Tax=Muricoccus vinaceus TaxID=424704 RepID=A0ABV6IZY9_9PROT